MRLEAYEKEIILETLNKVFGSVEVFLFGSRVNNDKKGGDIDLFVIPKECSRLLEKKIKSLVQLEKFLHKPVDLVIHKDFKRGIEQEILKSCILLQ